MKFKAALLLLIIFQPSQIDADYQIGVGRGDCTGPAAEIIFVGFAKISQVGCGLHLRQFSRAFIIDDGDSRVVFVSVDSHSMAHVVKREVLRGLASLYNDTYTHENVILSGIHTHSTPGGWYMQFLLQVSTLGFAQESFDALVDGITRSIINAHENMVEGKIFLTNGTLLDANINRSPASYLYNPEEERTKYDHDVDKEMVQLKFVRSSNNQPIGAINWFAVHANSMNSTNCLVSSDNMGYASILLEAHLNNGSLPGTGEFVGAFASSNLGDVSPNTKGPICIDTGEECDFVTSTCNGDATTCIAFGPGDNMFESTRSIAGKLSDKAKELFYQEDPVEVTGPVKYIHQYVDMPSEKATITLSNGTEQEIQGCTPALGYAFGGGTTDGPGEFPFNQGTESDSLFWNIIRNSIPTSTQEEKDCHAPKPILFNTGRANFPLPWQPRIVPTQILLFGQIALIAVPGEFTTMSGRRLRDAVQDTIISNGGPEDTKPVITGHSNDYTNYIATPEEYQLQRYEGASTIFGPQTLNLYINKYKELAGAMVKGQTVDPGPTPPDYSSPAMTVLPAGPDGVGQNFGECLQQPVESVSSGDTVVVKFVGGNPRHDTLRGGSYISVEKAKENEWVVVANDANWETRYLWKRMNVATGTSEVTIEWDVREGVEPGEYRIRHHGHHKTFTNQVKSYEGVSRNFTVT